MSNSAIFMSEAEKMKIAGLLKEQVKNPNFNVRIWAGLNRGKEIFEVFFAKVIKVIEEYPFSSLEKGFLLSKASKAQAEALENKGNVITKITSSEWRKEESSNRRKLYKEFEDSTETVQEFCSRKGIDVEKLRRIVTEFSRFPKELWSSRFESNVKSYTDEELEQLYQDWISSGKALSAWAKEGKISYNTIKAYIDRAHKEDYEKYRESGNITVDYETFFQIWKNSGKSLSLFCNEQGLVYKSFKDFIMEKHNGEYEEYKLKLQAKQSMSDEAIKACQKAYELKAAHPEWTIAKACSIANCDRNQFVYWLGKEGLEVKPSFVAKAEKVMTDVLDASNHESMTKLFTKHRITKEKFCDWVLHEGRWFELPEYFQKANKEIHEKEMEKVFQGIVRGLTPDEVCERNKGLKKEMLKAFVREKHPIYENKFAEPEPKIVEEICVTANVEILKDAGIDKISLEEQPEEAPEASPLDEAPVAKTPIVKEIAEENDLEVVEVKTETKEEVNPAKEVISEKLAVLSSNLEEVKELFAKMAMPKEEVVDSLEALCEKQDAEKVTISNNVVKEILAKVQELENMKTKLKAILG